VKTDPARDARPAPERAAGARPAGGGALEHAIGWIERRAAWIVGVAAVISAIVVLHASRGTSWFFDDWWFITRRRDASLDDFLRPWNGHLTAIPLAIDKVLFETVGLRTHTPYAVVLVALHVVTCVLLFVYLRRRAPVL